MKSGIKSDADTVALIAEIQTLKTTIDTLTEKATYYATEYDRIIQAFKQAQRERFGKKSERFIDEESGQLDMFSSADENNTSTEEPENSDVETITYVRKKQTKKQTAGLSIPTREVIIPVSEADRHCECGLEKSVIRYETSDRLNYQPAVFEMLIEKREVVACNKGCGKSIQTAPLPLRILPKCKVSESLLAYIAVAKVLDRQPLYHLEKKIEQRHHWRLPRQTMARWLIQLSDPLQPLINLMKETIVDYDIAAIDATTFQVLREPLRAPEKKSYA